MIKTARFASCFTLAVLLLSGAAFAQTDPGFRAGNRVNWYGAPSVLSNSPSGILVFFTTVSSLPEVESAPAVPTTVWDHGLTRIRVHATRNLPSAGQVLVVNPQVQFTSDGVAPKTLIRFHLLH